MSESFKIKFTTAGSPDSFIGSPLLVGATRKPVDVGGQIRDWDITLEKNGQYIFAQGPWVAIPNGNEVNVYRHGVPDAEAIVDEQGTQHWDVKFNDDRSFSILLPGTDLAWTDPRVLGGPDQIGLTPLAGGVPLAGQRFSLSIRGN